MVVAFTTTCAIIAYHHLSCEFEPHSWRGVLDKTLCGEAIFAVKNDGMSAGNSYIQM
jgi:hypothetical protein